MNRIAHYLVPMIFSVMAAYGQARQARLDSLMKKSGDDFLKEKPAGALSIGIYKNGKTYFYDYGSSDLSTNEKADLHTMYEIGSITKTFANYVLAHAASEGKVRLDDDIRKYLKGKYPNLEYQGHPITLRNLANTTSPLPDWLPEPPKEYQTDGENTSRLRSSFYAKLGKKDLYEALRGVRLDTVPGYHPKHSNAAAQLLAFILEDVYKKPMETLIAEYVCRPAGMEETSFTAVRNQKAAKGYDGSGALQPYTSEVPIFGIIGGLRSTTHDMLLYARVLMDPKPISQKVTAPDIAVSAATNKVVPYAWKGADPTVYGIGFGWLRYEPQENGLQIWADGNTSGFNAYLVLYPQHKAAVVLLSNKSDEKTYRSLPGIANQISGLLKD